MILLRLCREGDKAPILTQPPPGPVGPWLKTSYLTVIQWPLLCFRCDEAGLFPLIVKSGADRRGKMPVVSLIAGKEFRKWVVRNSDLFSPGYPNRHKRHRNIVLSFSHDSATTARLRTYNMSRDRLQHRRPTGKRSNEPRSTPDIGSLRTRDQRGIKSRSSGIVVSDADCCSVGTGFEPGEGMDVCKCIVPARHGGTLNSHRAASLLVRFVEGETRWEASDHPRVFSLEIGVEWSQIVLSPVWCYG
ncbi:hypothetical protein TNCV_369501 [Trichonephila clavipes]|nr:hypothetical protein TNCV_369501 [Trichonephila clavipes]